MAYINLSLKNNETPSDGKLVTFIAPCDCGTPEGLQLNGEIYELVDAMGRSVLGGIGVFCKNAIVAVILDVTNKRAFIQNAATAEIEKISRAQIDDLDDTEPIPDDPDYIISKEDIANIIGGM